MDRAVQGPQGPQGPQNRDPTFSLRPRQGEDADNMINWLDRGWMEDAHFDNENCIDI